jgi:hypothetical protein
VDRETCRGEIVVGTPPIEIGMGSFLGSKKGLGRAKRLESASEGAQVKGMELERRLKTALDESRLLIMGAQVLFGFQFHGVFQERFADLPAPLKLLQLAGLLLMLLALALLIAPSLHHQIIYGGESRQRVVRSATFYSGLSILPLTLGLGVSMGIVFAFVIGTRAGFVSGIGYTLMALGLLYGLGFGLKRARGEASMPKEEKETSLKTKIEQMLTEARVVIPGAQALLGFQFVATLTNAFAELPDAVKLVHLAALSAVALTAVLLMTPAAIHRLAYQGEDNETFFVLGSRLVVAAALPLAVGIAADVFVVFFKVMGTPAAGLMAGLTAFLVMTGLWLIYPAWRKARS